MSAACHSTVGCSGTKIALVLYDICFAFGTFIRYTVIGYRSWQCDWNCWCTMWLELLLPGPPLPLAISMIQLFVSSCCRSTLAALAYYILDTMTDFHFLTFTSFEFASILHLLNTVLVVFILDFFFFSLYSESTVFQCNLSID